MAYQGYNLGLSEDLIAPAPNTMSMTSGGGRGGGMADLDVTYKNPLLGYGSPYLGENVVSFNRGGKMSYRPKYFLGGNLGGFDLGDEPLENISKAKVYEEALKRAELPKDWRRPIGERGPFGDFRKSGKVPGKYSYEEIGKFLDKDIKWKENPKFKSKRFLTKASKWLRKGLNKSFLPLTIGSQLYDFYKEGKERGFEPPLQNLPKPLLNQPVLKKNIKGTYQKGGFVNPLSSIVNTTTRGPIGQNWNKMVETIDFSDLPITGQRAKARRKGSGSSGAPGMYRSASGIGSSTRGGGMIPTPYGNIARDNEEELAGAGMDPYYSQYKWNLDNPYIERNVDVFKHGGRHKYRYPNGGIMNPGNVGYGNFARMLNGVNENIATLQLNNLVNKRRTLSQGGRF